MSNLKKYNPQEFATKYSPVNIRKEYGRITTTKQAIDATDESLALCRKLSGEDAVIDTISLYLAALMKSINVKEPLTLIQIEECAEWIISTYYQISFVEIGFILKRGSNGEFGKLNTFAFNKDVIKGWFDQYQDERCVEFEKEQQKAHSERIRGKVEVDDQGNYMTVFVDEFRKNEEGRKKIFGALKNVLPESPKEKLEKTKNQILEEGIESTMIDNSEDPNLIEQKKKLLGENWRAIEAKAKEENELKRMQREAVEKYGK